MSLYANNVSGNVSDNVQSNESHEVNSVNVDTDSISKLFSRSFLSRNSHQETLLVGDSVPWATKELIWQNAVVDFIDLLKPIEKSKCPVDRSDKAANKANDPKCTFSDISLWTRAFSTYKSVLLEKDKSCKAEQELATYMQHICELHDAGFNWYSYDKQYRYERSLEENPQPWVMFRCSNIS